MDGVNILLIVMIGFFGVLTLLIGYQIRQHQSIESISLPNLAIKKVRDKAGFCRFTGNRAMSIGVSAIIAAVLMGLLPRFLMMTMLLLILLIAAFSLEFIISCKRYL